MDLARVRCDAFGLKARVNLQLADLKASFESFVLTRENWSRLEVRLIRVIAVVFPDINVHSEAILRLPDRDRGCLDYERLVDLL